MKTTQMFGIATLSAAALLIAAPLAQSQVLSAKEASNNRAVAASPRALEVFPWLGGTVPKAASAPSQVATPGSVSNDAFASSPRAREQFPELARAGTPIKAASVPAELSATLDNRALTASPRMIEQFPELARGYSRNLAGTCDCSSS